MMRVAGPGLAIVLVGCSSDLPPPGGPGQDAAVVGDGPMVDAPRLMWVDAAPGGGTTLPCRDLVSPAPDLGRHNTGMSCFNSCHNGRHGFTLAGTLYTNATGNTAYSGATISVTDSNNVTRHIVVNANGNFWTRDPIAFPVLVIASACPTAVRMNAAATSGDCNSCHRGNTNDQMHLP
jgi:hypothetical protein